MTDILILRAVLEAAGIVEFGLECVAVCLPLGFVAGCWLIARAIRKHAPPQAQVLTRTLDTPSTAGEYRAYGLPRKQP